MAGNKCTDRVTTIEDNIRDPAGRIVVGFPIIEIVINGNIERDDEWILFRLTDDGVAAYREMSELRAGIMTVLIAGKNAGEEIARYKTEEEALNHWKELFLVDKERTLLRSVRPQKAF